MLNFVELKERIAEIVGLTADKVAIGFTKRAYEVTFTEALAEDLTAEQACEIIEALGNAVVKTIKFATADEASVVVVFCMN